MQHNKLEWKPYTAWKHSYSKEGVTIYLAALIIYSHKWLIPLAHLFCCNLIWNLKNPLLVLKTKKEEYFLLTHLALFWRIPLKDSALLFVNVFPSFVSFQKTECASLYLRQVLPSSTVFTGYHDTQHNDKQHYPHLQFLKLP